MIDREGPFGAVPHKRFFRQIFTFLEFVVIIGEPAAGQADAQVRVRPQQPHQPHFGIQINRRQGQAQGDVGVEEIRLVHVIIAIRSDGRGAAR
jgi:hypothetical protein